MGALRRSFLIFLSGLALGTGYGFFVHRDELFPYWPLRNAALALTVPVQTPADNPAAEAKREYFAAFPAHADAVMVGDSITELARFDAMFPGLKVVNQGISGDTTVGLLGRLKEIKQTKAKAIALMFGLNDFATYRQRVADVTDRYMRAVKDLKTPDNCVLVQSTLPTQYLPAINAKIRDLNEQVAEACAQTKLCTFIDLNATIAPAGTLLPGTTFDGIHPAAKLLLLWRDALLPYLHRCLDAGRAG